MLKDFKAFLNRGSVVDLAVAVVIGAAFGSVVTSFVKNLLSPIIGLFGKHDFSGYYTLLSDPAGKAPYASMAEAQKAGANVLSYGAFITDVINFIIIAFAIFVVMRLFEKMKKKEQEAPAAAPAPDPQITLLSEIRDLLKK